MLVWSCDRLARSTKHFLQVLDELNELGIQFHSQRESIDTEGPWWEDVPGQYKRAHKRAKICPISGVGKLTVSERKRRAREIVSASGADSVEHLDKVALILLPKTTRREITPSGAFETRT